jgi:hypothetical protein
MTCVVLADVGLHTCHRQTCQCGTWYTPQRVSIVPIFVVAVAGSYSRTRVLIVDLPCFGSMGKTEAFEKASKLFIPYLHHVSVWHLVYPTESLDCSYFRCRRSRQLFCCYLKRANRRSSVFRVYGENRGFREGLEVIYSLFTSEDNHTCHRQTCQCGTWYTPQRVSIVPIFVVAVAGSYRWREQVGIKYIIAHYLHILLFLYLYKITFKIATLFTPSGYI